MIWRIRKPEFIPTLFTFIVVSTMLGLGYWQLQRLEYKTALLARIEHAQSQASQDLSASDLNTLADKEWFNVTVTGRFHYDKELYATPRYLNGRLGYAVLTPLEFAKGGNSHVVLVNRGWVDSAHKDPHTRQEFNTTAPVIVTGVIRSHTLRRGLFQPDNRPDQNAWFWYDLPAMEKAAAVALLPVLIDATRVIDGNSMQEIQVPKAFPLKITIRNDHFGYALLWFSMGIIALIMFLAYYRQPKSPS